MRFVADRLIRLTVVVAFALLGLVGWLALRTERDSVAVTEWVEHAHAVIEGLNALLAHLGAAESVQRGFLITGDATFLEPYRASVEEARADMRQLEQLLAGDASQQGRLRKLAPLVEERLERLEEVMRIQREESHDAAVAFVKTGRGRDVMNAVRNLVSDMRTDERVRLWTREAAEDEATRRRAMTVMASVVLAIVGMAVSLVAVERGLTARREALQLEQSLNGLLGSAREAVVGHRLDGSITFWNAAAERLLGWSPGEVLGRPADVLVPQEHRAELVRAADQVARGETLAAFRTERMHQDGSRIPVAITIWPVKRANGSVQAFTALMRDLREDMAEQNERDATLSEMKAALERAQMLSGLLPACAWCRRVRDADGSWGTLEAYVVRHHHAGLTHGICPECDARVRMEARVQS